MGVESQAFVVNFYFLLVLWRIARPNTICAWSCLGTAQSANSVNNFYFLYFSLRDCPVRYATKVVFVACVIRIE